MDRLKLDSQSSDQPMKHAFVVFGSQNLYLAHSAMFLMPEHAYQVIQEVTLTSESDHQRLISMRQIEPQTLILALSQTPAVLYDLLRGNFVADLYRTAIDDLNHFGIVTFVPQRLVYYNPLNQFAPKYPAALTYLLFGRDGDVFLSHVITQRQNFHHEVTLEAAPEGVSAGDLERGIQVTVVGLQDGFYPSDPLPEPAYQVVLPNGTISRVVIKRRDRFTFTALNGDG
ncbi:hypothetical protein [Chondromyces apiculatus]|uniref:Uncharacterized protein n=1 Tax=Chondromyces apiculatus DSM 436 TaxID=1192034 RepID=A0A017T892_9BACT|nr:hypothetical protein [Chondromyces apiculatus]EYF05015.1 Hypothetical protein CAP_3605 [Chondromyces apiculatus DSM 436]